MLWVKMEDYSVYEKKNSSDDCDVECADLLPKIYLFICEFCRSSYFNTKLNVIPGWVGKKAALWRGQEKYFVVKTDVGFVQLIPCYYYCYVM